MTSPLLALIAENNWGVYQPLMDRLMNWEGWPLFLKALSSLDHSALYDSKVHGLGHIERTLLHGAFCAMEEPLSMADTQLLLECCSYHDVGRINDRYDEYHGLRSSQKLADLTGRHGEELRLIQAAVEAHSKQDSRLLSTLDSYHHADPARALRLAHLLKDSDGLDRVRIWDLDVRFLRRKASQQRAGFAEYLYQRYQKAAGSDLIPQLDCPKMQRMLQSHYDRWQTNKENH